ncbi:MAG: GtrA-like protein [Verrucomicrobiota bacterium]
MHPALNKTPMFDRDTLGKAFRFCLTGGFVCCVDMAMLWVWSRFTPPRVAVSIAYLIAVGVHFCLNKWWVFQNRSGAARVQVVSYAITVGACWLCMFVLFLLSLRFLTSNIFVAKLIALPPTTMLSFVLMRFFVFRQKKVA